jgi:hypothetical protein
LFVPAPPNAWIAQSTTWHAMFGAAILIIAISRRASLLPTVSIIAAVFSVSRRVCSIMMRASAIRSSVTVCSDTGLPNATRCCVRRHIISSARSARPIRRMQWWMRPGPSRPCAISKPRPSPSSMFDAGTRTSVNWTSDARSGIP